MKRKVISALCILICLGSIAEGAVKLRNGKFVDAAVAATMPVEDHYEAGKKAFEARNWKESARQFKTVVTCFPLARLASESWFYLGVSEYQLDELDASNDAFTSYLKGRSNPKHFQEAIEFKFQIAEKLSRGVKRRFFGVKKMPKWAPGDSLALQIYDEVIAALPCHDLTAKALFAKGNLNHASKLYKHSVDAYQMLIRRFPKHELAPESYVAISKVFLEQSKTEFQNPDVLAFAEINQRKFQLDFPKEARIAEVEQDLLNIKETYAKGLFETGLFYERVRKPIASVIYYQKTIKLFPETQVAKQCVERLEFLKVTKKDPNNK